MDAQKVWFGVATALKGKEVRILHPKSIASTMSIISPLKSLGRIGQEDWEVGRVASSCHLSLDLLCQEMWDACREKLTAS